MLFQPFMEIINRLFIVRQAFGIIPFEPCLFRFRFRAFIVFHRLSAEQSTCRQWVDCSNVNKLGMALSCSEGFKVAVLLGFEWAAGFHRVLYFGIFGL